MIKSGTLIGRNTIPFVMNEVSSFDIDNNFELDIADFIIGKIHHIDR